MAADTTRLGSILGTAAYMSPEQARGLAVDKRADIWAFGVCLFEALTGSQAFGGETTSDSVAAILTRDPPWESLPAGTPEPLLRLLRRCLEKDARQRLRDIGDARIELDRLAGDGRGQSSTSGIGTETALAAYPPSFGDFESFSAFSNGLAEPVGASYRDLLSNKTVAFFGYLAANVPQVQFLIYSRGHFDDSEATRATLESWIARFPLLDGRIHTYFVPSDPQTAETSWTTPEIADGLRRLVIETLDL